MQKIVEVIKIPVMVFRIDIHVLIIVRLLVSINICVHVSIQVLVHHQFNIVFTDSNLHPFLEQINQIDENVTALEQAAYKLDNYSKRLGLFKVNCYFKI